MEPRQPVTEAREAKKPLALEGAVYTVAFFTGSPFIMLSVIMPLWALEMGAGPLLIGLIISSRQVLVITMAVHGGALLDRFGPRTVIILMGIIGASTMSLFPFFPFVAAIVFLQMISGFAETTTWIGAQTLVGRLLGGRPVYAGRMTAVARVGGFIGPWATGLAWQFISPAVAFWFLALWVLLGGLSAWFLPKEGDRPSPSPSPASADAETPAADTAPAAGRRRASVLPSLSDYATTFRLLLVAAVALVIVVTFVRQTGSGIQSSFYGVWLKEIGYEAGTIGLLLAIANAASAGAALTIGPLTRRISEHWLLIAATILAIASIAITPLLGSFAILALAIGLRGVGQGLNFPLMLAIASRAVGPHLQGRVVALRITFNRLGGALVPFIMGALAEVIGLEAAFYVIGITGILLLGLVGVWISRVPAFNSPPR
jgi:MFS family permease